MHSTQQKVILKKKKKKKINKKKSFHCYLIVAQWCHMYGYRSTLDQAMACALICAQPLPEPMLTYCQLDPDKQMLETFDSKYITMNFSQQSAFQLHVHVMLTGELWDSLKSLWPSDAIWQQRSGLTLFLVTAWYQTTSGAHLTKMTLIAAWISNYILSYKVWYVITYLFPNSICATNKVLELMSNFILHITEHVITYPCLV